MALSKKDEPASDDEFISWEDVKRKLRIKSDTTLNNWAKPGHKYFKSGFPKKVKIGHRNYFRRKEFDAWLQTYTGRGKELGGGIAPTDPPSPSIDQQELVVQESAAVKRSKKPNQKVAWTRTIALVPGSHGAPKLAARSGKHHDGDCAQARVPAVPPKLALEERADPGPVAFAAGLGARSKIDRQQRVEATPGVRVNDRAAPVQQSPKGQNQLRSQGEKQPNQDALSAQLVKDPLEQQSSEQPNTSGHHGRPEPRTFDEIQRYNVAREAEYERALREAVPPGDEKTYLQDIVKRWGFEPADPGKRK
jgi:predicted DNA-binding transcriptional regulator AlpA